MQKVRPIQGGTRIAGPKNGGTLGLVVTNLDTGTVGFLTAGHVVGEQHTLVGQPTTDNLIGRVELNTYAPDAATDIAFAKVVVGVESDLETIWTSTGSFQIQVMAAYPEKDQRVRLCGPRSESQEGIVIHANADITVTENGVPLQLKGVSIATYPSTPSDSGAPIVSVDRNEVEWLGIHGGVVTIEGQQYRWFTPLATINRVVHIYNAD